MAVLAENEKRQDPVLFGRNSPSHSIQKNASPEYLE
eukprot:CAMPEP_0170126152 /NCGR_PEP_ID=MMETSP0020_2-20130122/19491_1 /TAXON_ID=98059 /ORGANISM="Dinobryon sp., Strain UTEXLB2267" /LENGTH=35 /DNA_ID= /DNA_START= /DNA_END= /DNA_ORIENTATION=